MTSSASLQKTRVVEEIREYLEGEIREARERGETDSVKEIERLLLMYRFLPMRDYSADDVVVPAALVELELDGRSAHYFVTPQGGGLITRVDGFPVQVITPNSPLGEALLGKKAGDAIDLDVRGGIRHYRVKRVS